MKTKTWAIGLMVLCTLFISIAQILFKLAVTGLELSLFGVITNLNLILGLFLYAIGAVLILIALKGGEVTVLFPIMTSSYIWVTLMSSLIIGEDIKLLRWIAIGVIFTGILFIGIAGNKDSAVKYEGIAQ